MADEQAKPEAGWYAAPGMPGARRYWDGSRWTDHVTPEPAPDQAGAAVKNLLVILLALGIAVVVLVLVSSTMA